MKTLKDIFWRTLICNLTVVYQKAPPALETSYRKWRKIFIDSAASDASAEDLKHIVSKPYARATRNNMERRVFGRTGNGYVGMFPRATRSGDEIYILYGGDFPFVLRKLEQPASSQLVGQCYVHGIMEGSLPWWEYTPETICLR